MGRFTESYGSIMKRVTTGPVKVLEFAAGRVRLEYNRTEGTFSVSTTRRGESVPYRKSFVIYNDDLAKELEGKTGEEIAGLAAEDGQYKLAVDYAIDKSGEMNWVAGATVQEKPKSKPKDDSGYDAAQQVANTITSTMMW